MTDKIVVFSTCETEKEARRIARALVEARFAACVNIVHGMCSVYRWKGAVEEASELLLRDQDQSRIAAGGARDHPNDPLYELPEVIALPIVDGSDSVSGWLSSGLKPIPDASR